MKSLRLWFWDTAFIFARWLTDLALVRRSKACGCEACKYVAHLTVTLNRFRLNSPTLARTHAGGEARPN